MPDLRTGASWGPTLRVVVFQLVYGSLAVRDLDRAELLGLLRQARARNLGQRVTGMLLYRHGRFLQLLEGAQDDVRSVYASIAADPRHRDVTTLSERRRVLRQFPSWTMAFRDLVEEPITEPGYNALFDSATVEQVPRAVAELVRRLRPSGPHGRPVVHASRVLGLL